MSTRDICTSYGIKLPKYIIGEIGTVERINNYSDFNVASSFFGGS